MHFSIFLPGKRGANLQHLADFGIEDLARDNGPDFVHLSQGIEPCRKPGMLATWRPKGGMAGDPPLDDHPDFTWHPSFVRPNDDDETLEEGRYFYGINHNDPPRPDDLKRLKQYDGYEYRMGDGKVWTIPSVQNVPHTYGLDRKTGRARKLIRDPRFHEYERRAAAHAGLVYGSADDIRYISHLYGMNDEEFRQAAIDSKYLPDDFSAETIEKADMQVAISFSEAWEQVIDGLSINYRLNDELVTILNLLDSDDLVSVCCCAAFDLELVREHVKKKEQGSQLEIDVASII